MKKYSYYVVTVKCQFEEEITVGKNAGKFKTVNMKNKYLVHTDSVTNAEKLIKDLLIGSYDSFEIIEVKETNYLLVVEDSSINLISE